MVCVLVFETVEFLHLGGAISVEMDLSVEVTQLLQRVWSCFGRGRVGNLRPPGGALAAEGADAESRGNRDAYCVLYRCVRQGPNKNGLR